MLVRAPPPPLSPPAGCPNPQGGGWTLLPFTVQDRRDLVFTSHFAMPPAGWGCTDREAVQVLKEQTSKSSSGEGEILKRVMERYDVSH